MKVSVNAQFNYQEKFPFFAPYRRVEGDRVKGGKGKKEVKE